MIRAKYTVVLHTLMTDPQLKEQLDLALSTYPLYKAGKLYDLIPTRDQLNDRLLNHYKYREIGFETIGRFLDELKITMGEIMPRYNELFKTVEIMAELPSPFDNVDVVETFEEQKTNTSTSDTTTGSTTSGTSNDSTQTTGTAEDSTQTTGTASSHNKHVNSKTPQDGISIPAEGIDSVDYADEAQWNKDTSTTGGTSTSNGSTSGSSTSNGSTSETSEGSANVINEGSETTTHTYTKKGNQGVNTYAHDMNEFRTSIIDVMDQIVNDRRIRELFMLVY
jgi:hypothetical protein